MAPLEPCLHLVPGSVGAEPLGGCGRGVAGLSQTCWRKVWSCKCFEFE